ncbi:MAG: hypothetical protein AAGF46_09550 [Pseudomonadota bacterium]
MTTRNIMLSLAALILCGCAPTIESISVGTGEPGVPLPVTVSIDKQQTTLQAVRVVTRRTGSSDASSDSLTGSGGRYAGVTPRQSPGDYEAVIEVDYRRAGLPGVKTRTSMPMPYSLAWPLGTFGFETGRAGWRYNGVLSTSADFIGCDDTTLNSLPWFHHTPAGWPLDIGDTAPDFAAGALRAGFSATCYPDTESELAPGSGYWGFELISPDLTEDSHWQGIDGLAYRVRGSLNGLLVVGLLEVNIEGAWTWVGPLANNGPQFTEVTHAWTDVVATGFVPSGATVRRIMIRGFGEPGWLAGPVTTELLVDVVRPVTLP